MPNHRIETIGLEYLYVDLLNPRIEAQDSQRDAIAAIAVGQGPKLFKLAKDIVDKGLNPSELPIVTEPDENGIHTVLEGNRRIAALKLVVSPELAESLGLERRIVKRFKDLHAEAAGILPRNIPCVVMDREDATHWIMLKHTGENEGVGIVSWDGATTQRFRGHSPALHAIDLVKARNYLDDNTVKKLPQISITNVERLLRTPEVRQELGIDIRRNQLLIVGDENETLGRLAIVVSEIANGQIKVSDIDTKQQRIDYASKVALQPLPTPGKPIRTSVSSVGSSTNSKPKQARIVTPSRKALIPRNFKISIGQNRINQIYDELRRLDVDSYTNSCAVMLRVFVELSIDHFASEKKISLQQVRKPSGGNNATQVKLKPRDMTLREKIKTIVSYLEINQLCTPAELQGIKSIQATRDHILSLDSLNAFVHNRNYNPAPSDLKAHWDSIEPFMRILWT